MYYVTRTQGRRGGGFTSGGDRLSQAGFGLSRLASLYLALLHSKPENSVIVCGGAGMNTIDELQAENNRLKTALAKVEAESSNWKDGYQKMAVATAQLEHRLNEENVALKNSVQDLSTQTDVLTTENRRLGAGAIVATRDIEALRGQFAQASSDVGRLTTAAEGKVPEARRDLIRRLVAVAISVGFATQIVTMGAIDHWAIAVSQWHWSLPSWNTIALLNWPLLEKMARLCTSMLVILLAWDWYDRDLRAKPLTGIGRFILDAIIVFAELVLLLSSSHSHLWAVALVVIFALYIVWDLLSIVDHPSAFGLTDPRPHWWLVPQDVLCTYWGGLTGNARRRGPPINVTWFLYFLIVLLLLPFRGTYGGFVTCLMVTVGASLLWCEGGVRKNGTSLISFCGRSIALLCLGIVYAGLWVWLP